MAQIQDYQVNYDISVKADGIDKITDFANAISKLKMSQDAGGGRTQSVSIPILTLVPLPLLQVQEADFDFDIKILDALSETAEEKFSLEEGKSLNEPQSGGGFKLRASLAPKQGEGSSTSNVQQSLSANMKVKVKMRQADMPAGLSNLLHLTASNMQVEETEAEEITEGGNK